MTPNIQSTNDQLTEVGDYHLYKMSKVHTGLLKQGVDIIIYIPGY